MSGVAIIRQVAALRALVRRWKAEGLTVGLVPTMGALHEGHLDLVRTALAACDRVVVTLFVNPKQFNNAGDLAAYPRTETDDARLLEGVGAHCLYAPDAVEMYPAGFATTVTVEGVSEGLCGAFRPGHFAGVATVVTKLLLQSGADRAFFGEKDYQQLQVIRRLVRDLDVPVEIIACPTRREVDGLALSSRNRRLSPPERETAGALPRALFAAAGRIAAGGDVGPALAAAREALETAGFGKVEYVELRRADDLAPVATQPVPPSRLLAAAWLGETRLIDNVPVAAVAEAHLSGS